jgi:hypothetical protein
MDLDLDNRRMEWQQCIMTVLRTRDEDEIYSLTVQIRLLLRADKSNDTPALSRHRDILKNHWTVNDDWIDEWIKVYRLLEFDSGRPRGDELLNWLYNAPSKLASKSA